MLNGFSQKVMMLVVACLSVLSISRQLSAQSSYGSIVGAVADQSGAIIPGAKVTLTNSATSENLVGVTNTSGNYQFVNLQPGIYKIDILVPGFKELTRDQVEVGVSVATRVDAVMQVGDVGQKVEVTSAVPLLNTEDATVGQVVEGRTVTEMPLNGRNVMNVITLAPGVVAHGQSQGQSNRSGISNYQISGGMSAEGKIEVDGVPLETGLFNGASFVPIQDTVQEFQVMGNNIPPEFGGTLNGIINLATKSGTNQYHATAYEFLRNRVLNANTFFNNQAGIPRPAFTQHQFGVNGGGPIIRGKTFVYMAWEDFLQDQGVTQTFTVPTQAERAGDFSNLRTASGALIPIYDPMTTCGQFGNPACAPGQTVLRQQFPGNVIPRGRFDATASAMMKYWPLPSSAGAANTSANNFIVNQGVVMDRNWEFVRVDQVISNKQRIFATFERFNNINPPYDWYGLGVDYSMTTGSHEGMLADTYTLNSTTVLDGRMAYSRTEYTRTPNTLGLDLSTIGWPTSYNSQFLTTQLPVMNVQGMSNSAGGQTTTTSTSTIARQYAGVGYFAGSLTKVAGRHTVKLGGDYSWMPTAYVSGVTSSFAFTTGFTASNPLTPGNTGAGFASYLLGLGNSGSVGNALAPYSSMHPGALYAGDKFVVNNRLNINAGVRWQYPGYWSERTGLATVFLPTATNPVLNSAGLNHPGDVVLVNSPRYPRGITQAPHWDLFAPQIGAAYRLNEKMVVRAGFGMTYAPGAYSQYQLPFESPIVSATTSWVPTQNSGLTPVATLSNPFPKGINAAPGRNPQYESTILGAKIIASTPNNPFPYIENWNAGFAWQLGKSSVLDVTYVGTHGVHLTAEGDPTPPGGPNLDQIPTQYLSLGSQLLTAVPNPFYGTVSVGPLAQPTVPYGQLLLPYPQFSSVYSPNTAQLDEHYKALEAKFQRQFQAGGTLLVSYTWSKNYGNADTLYGHTEPFQPGTLQNYYDPQADNSLLSFDVRQLLTVGYVLNLPFGKGQRFLGGTNEVVNQLVSGWGVDGITTLQSGFPMPLLASATALSTNFGAGPPRPNVTAGCKTNVSGRSQGRLQQWFNTACFTQPSTFGFGDEPRNDPNIRNSGIANYDFALFRNAAVFQEKLHLQFRVEIFNLFNRVQFGPPGNTVGTAQFGIVSSQINNPRLFQFGFRLTY